MSPGKVRIEQNLGGEIYNEDGSSIKKRLIKYFCEDCSHTWERWVESGEPVEQGCPNCGANSEAQGD